jgi:hypothetical protein
MGVGETRKPGRWLHPSFGVARWFGVVGGGFEEGRGRGEGGGRIGGGGGSLPLDILFQIDNLLRLRLRSL